MSLDHFALPTGVSTTPWAARDGGGPAAAARLDARGDTREWVAPLDDRELRRRTARRRRLGLWPRVLMAIGSVMAVVAILATWLNAQVLSTEGWTRTSVRVLENPRVREGVAKEISGRVLGAAEDLANHNLPPALAPLDHSLSLAGTNALTPGVERALETSTAKELWAVANRDVHAQVTRFLTGGSSTLSTTGGVVALNLEALFNSVGHQLGVGNVGEALPAEKAELVLARSDQLHRAQMAVEVLRPLHWIAPALALLFYLAALAVVPGRRARALVEIGAWIVAAALVALLLRRVVESYVVNELVHNESTRPAVSAALSILTSGWRERALWLLVPGVLAMAAGAFALRRRSAR
jgi:hypothetical protein